MCVYMHHICIYNVYVYILVVFLSRPCLVFGFGYSDLCFACLMYILFTILHRDTHDYDLSSRVPTVRLRVMAACLRQTPGCSSNAGPTLYIDCTAGDELRYKRDPVSIPLLTRQKRLKSKSCSFVLDRNRPYRGGFVEGELRD